MAIDAAKLHGRRLPAPPTDGAAGMAAPPKVDGRSLRATHRTVQMNFKVREETRTDIQEIAAARGIMMTEVLKEAIALLKQQYQRRQKSAPKQ